MGAGRGRTRRAQASAKITATAGDAMVPLSEVSHLVGEQTQYVSRYHTGSGGEVLSQGLTITEPGVGGDYHQMKIARKDVPTFAARIIQFYEDRRVLSEEEVKQSYLKIAEYVAKDDPRVRTLLAERVWSLSANGWSTIEGGDRMSIEDAFYLQQMRGFNRAELVDINDGKTFALKRGAVSTIDEPPVRLGQLYNEDASGMIGRLRVDLREFGDDLLSEMNGKLSRDDAQALAHELTDCLNNDQFSRFGQLVGVLCDDHELPEPLADRYEELLG